MKITNRIVEAYLDCKYKSHLLLKGESGTPPDYQVLLDEFREERTALATSSVKST